LIKISYTEINSSKAAGSTLRVLIVEDDKTVQEFIAKGLKELGYTVDIASDGKDGLFLAMTEQYDVIILDRMLPGTDGLTIINTIRASGVHTPTLFLSAKSKVEDRVAGLRAGADDYLTKPFSFEELAVRLEVLVKRSSPTSQQDSILKSYDLAMDLLSRTVTRAGQSIPLKAKEFKLLEYFLRHKGQVVTRTMLLEHVWDYQFDPQTNIIDVHVSRLR
jgi:two-component system OmpR family response regulator